MTQSLRQSMSVLPGKSHLELSEVFHHCDGNADGRIDISEFMRLLNRLDARISPKQASIGFSAIDSDRDGCIELREFIVWFRAHTHQLTHLDSQRNGPC
jgi:Ca2+-binding EF-hand superfamily protein